MSLDNFSPFVGASLSVFSWVSLNFSRAASTCATSGGVVTGTS